MVEKSETKSVEDQIKYYTRWLLKHRKSYAEANDIDKQSLKKKMLRLIYKIQSLQNGIDFKQEIHSYHKPYESQELEDSLYETAPTFQLSVDISQHILLNTEFFTSITNDIKKNADDSVFITDAINMLISSIDFEYEEQKVQLVDVKYKVNEKAYLIYVKMPGYYCFIKDDPVNIYEELSYNIQRLIDIVYSYLNYLLPSHSFLVLRVYD